MALPQAAFALPVTVVILRPFLQALPNELEEAALLDGASRIGFFWRILLPLSKPGMVTVGVLAFVGSWNAYLLPLLLLQDKMKTLPLGVADFSSEHSSDIAGVFAFTSLAMIPALIFFLAMQKQIVNGLQAPSRADARHALFRAARGRSSRAHVPPTSAHKESIRDGSPAFPP